MKMTEQSNDQVNVVNAHKHSIQHKKELQASALCGCFYCLKTFTPAAIINWIDEGDGKGLTAQCPYCDVDAVIGDQSGYQITELFLISMHDYWFTEDLI